jgi:hypothetical protein
MNLLDSNIVIAAATCEDEAFDRALLETPYSISIVTRIEVLGFHRLTSEDKADLQAFLDGGWEIPLTSTVADIAVRLRQERRMSLGDAIIAASALAHGLPLVTRNIDDFKHVTGLELKNPFTAR